MTPGESRVRRRRVAAPPLLLLPCLALALLGCGGGSDAASGDSDLEAPPAAEDERRSDEPPTSAVAWRTVEFVDESRPTAEIAGGDGEVLLAASDTRTLSTPMLYPGADDGGEDSGPAAVDPRPLVVWLNGLAGMAAAGDPLLLDLFEAGYVVAAPNVPEIARPASNFEGFVHQPADVSFIVDALKDDSDGIADDLAPIIDFDKIAILGHSTGAVGMLGLVGHDCCRDDRFSAAVGFGTNRLQTFEGPDYDLGETPLLLIRGDGDDVGPEEQAEQILAAAGSHAYLVTVPNADHFTPVYGADNDPTAQEFASAAVLEFLSTFLTGEQPVKDLEKFGATLPPGSWHTNA